MEAAALELEDDVFFADLSKQISLLIMDDDESLVDQFPSVNLQAFHQAIHIPATGALYYDQGKRESKGTGVFIPLSSHSRRRNKKQGRFTASRNHNKFERPSDDQYHISRGLPQMAYNNNINSSYFSSSNLRRF